MVQIFCEPCARQAYLARLGLAPIKPSRYGVLRIKRTVVPTRMTWGRHRRGSAPMFIEDLVADALDGTGLNAAEILHLNVDGSCFLNAIVPVQGDSVASSAVHKGSSGRFSVTSSTRLNSPIKSWVLRRSRLRNCQAKYFSSRIT